MHHQFESRRGFEGDKALDAVAVDLWQPVAALVVGLDGAAFDSAGERVLGVKEPTVTTDGGERVTRGAT